MKKCDNCSAEVPDEFTICWKCNYHFASKTIATFVDLQKEEERKSAKKDDSNTKTIDCLRCMTPMEYKGLYKLSEPQSFWLGVRPWDQLSGMILETYVCPKCKKVEFFDSETL